MSNISPYESSVPADGGASVASTRHTWRSAAGRVAALKVLLVVNLIGDLAVIVLNVMAVTADVDNWGVTQIGDMLYSTFWASYMGVGLVIILFYLLTAVVFCMWIYRANANARALGAEEMAISPGWSVGWFFVPIANLIKPYHAIREIYQASDPEGGAVDWKESAVPEFIGLWWGLWVFVNILGRIESRMAESDDPGVFNAGCWVGALGGVLGVALCLAAMKVIHEIEQRQHSKAVRQGVEAI